MTTSHSDTFVPALPRPRDRPISVHVDVRAGARPMLLLTACSRQDDPRWHRTTPNDTGRHVEPGSVPGWTNLRIRCPKGRGSSTLPSRTSF